MVTLKDIEIYKEIGIKIDNLAKAYYEEFIYCNDTYEYLGWEMDDNNEITIMYSYLDYNDERTSDYVMISIDILNGDIVSMVGDKDSTPEENIFYRG